MAKVDVWTYQDAKDVLTENGGGFVFVNGEGELIHSDISPKHHADAIKSAHMWDLSNLAARSEQGWDGTFAVVTTHFPGTEREDIEVG